MLKRFLLVLPFMFLAQPAAYADPKNDVEIRLEQHKVVKKANGAESLISADKIKPGDVIEYRATYRNTASHTISNLAANLPVPAETEFVPNSARPANVTASTDGAEYNPLPLKRKVKLPNGQEEERTVPVAEYRFLRWQVGELAAGKTVAVTARVHVNAVQASQPGDGGKKMR